MERLRLSFQQWHVAKSLVVQVARELAADFESRGLRAELKAALTAEKKAREEFEKLFKNEKERDGD